MSKNEDTIERTPEYEAFIQDLREFHKQKGTSLQAEPVLGRKRLDLLKFYKLVLAAGGFEQVTKKRSWKHIGENFRLPSTCTNSAYILKGLYIRNLFGYEEERVWGRTWIPPPELLGAKSHKASTLAGSTFKRSSSTAAMTNDISQDLIAALFSPIAPEPGTKLPPAATAAGVPTPFSVDGIIPAQTLPSTDNKTMHNCPISELHHQTQPFDHVHAAEALHDCAQAENFDNEVKQRVMFCLRSQNEADIEWAINKIVIISFESPKKLRLDNTPGLLDLLLDIAAGFLRYYCEGSSNHERLFEPTLKVLHILRNFSFLNINARMLASNNRMTDILFKILNISTCSQLTEMARHCIDILENLAGHIELVSPFDDCIMCLASLLYTDERYLLLGTIRMLTLLVSKVENQPFLMTGSEHTLPRMKLLLLTQDEELVGTSLEYFYVYTRIFPQFRYQLLSSQHGAFIGILSSLLLAKSRYFCPKIIKQIEDGSTPSPKAEVDLHSALPCVPNLSLYQQLDEPYRCLGWLKDKFEPSDPSSTLSLDDMYLLYEMRFGKEKALKMKEFYTVLKIAFPSVTSPDSSSGPVLEGISIRGIQIKMSILQDGAELLCQWTGCTESFQDEILLEQHVVNEHILDKPSEATSCLWTNCSGPNFKDQEDMMQHVRNHVNGATSCDVYAIATSATAPTSIDNSEITGTALAAAYLLRQLAKDPHSHEYFRPFEMELLAAAKRRPNLVPHIESIFSYFKVS